ncbi:MAG: polymer-forming cytoskeletal protein [Ardenticatenaceae bacterium]|nr:polymer-forming cytoskeletal protein [Ardenticatenaceae bacterium]MCB9445390.1 polymer-forming cytoskeletal protein [Ardenticatenaceae bacterium]
MKQKRILILMTVLLLLLISTSAVLAQSNGTVVETDETIRNDIALFGEDLTVEEGATVKGNVALFGGNATISGTVDGDIVLFGGNLTATGTAVIDGECALLGGSLTDDTEMGINCTAASFGENFAPVFSELAAQFEPPAPPEIPDIEIRPPSAARQFFGGVAEAAGQTLVLALLAFGVASLLPNHLNQAESAVRRQPVTSGAVGMLTAVAVPILLVLLVVTSAILVLVCIGILGFPIVFLLAVGFFAAMLFGWITMGDLAGRWLAEKMNLQNRSLPVTAALGTAALTFGIGLIGATPFMFGEGFLTVIIGSIGLGAATLTRMGTRPYPFHAGYNPREEEPITENPDKINSILETLPVEDVDDLKHS